MKAPPHAPGLFPGGHRHPPAHPNCRCALVAWRREWDEATTAEPAKKEPRERRRGPQPGWASDLAKGDYTEAREALVGQIRQRYDLTPQHVEPAGVAIANIESRGQYRISDGAIDLMPEVAEAAERFAALGDGGRRAMFDAVRAGGALPKGATFADIDGMRTFAHETMHGFSPLQPQALQGNGIFLEEVSTEVMARRFIAEEMGAPRGLWYRVNDAPGTTPMGGYAAEVDTVVASVKTSLGVSNEEAVSIVEGAAQAFKRRPAGSIASEGAAVEAFVEGLPEGARAGLRMRLKRRR